MMENNIHVTGLLGEHIEQSLSPFIHQYLIQYYGLNYIYIPFQITFAELEDAFKGIRALRLRGVNITNPFKELSLKYMDNLDSSAVKIGALNTVVLKDGRLYGSNTDWIGFQKPLQERENFSLVAKKAIILGAGGAARGVVYALAVNGCSEIIIINRSSERALELKKMAAGLNFHGEIRILSAASADLQKEIDNTNLLINTTPLGSWYYPSLCLLPEEIKFNRNTIIYDLIYNPAQTPLLKRGEENGNRVINGRPMLVCQAAESFYLWTGIKPEQQVLNRLLKQLNEKFRREELG